jgi:toxin ParE1/3/4
VARVLFTRSADSDTAKIIADLGAKAGRRVAERYDGDFKGIYRQLAKYPESGAPRPHLGKHVRIFVVDPYIIFFEYADADDIPRFRDEPFFDGCRRITE